MNYPNFRRTLSYNNLNPISTTHNTTFKRFHQKNHQHIPIDHDSLKLIHNHHPHITTRQNQKPKLPTIPHSTKTSIRPRPPTKLHTNTRTERKHLQRVPINRYKSALSVHFQRCAHFPRSATQLRPVPARARHLRARQ